MKGLLNYSSKKYIFINNKLQDTQFKMSWEKELEEKISREKLSENLGGKERVKKQHAAGRYTIRERINILTDKSSFHEIGKISGSATYDENNDLEQKNGETNTKC